MSPYDFLAKLLVEEFGVPASEIRPEATVTDLGLDSLSAAELVEEVEREFHVEFSSDQAMFSTLGEAVAIVEGLVSARSA